MSDLGPLSANRSLRANTLWLLTGTAIYGACQWGMLIVIAQLGQPRMLGQFSLGYAISLPVTLLFNLQLRSIQASDARCEFAFGEYLALRLVCMPGAFIMIVAIAVLAGYPAATAAIIGAVGLVKAIDSISEVFQGLFQQHERMDRMAISMIARGLLSLVALSLAVFLTGGVLWGVLAMAVAVCFVLVLFELPMGARTLVELSGACSSPRGQTPSSQMLRPRWQADTMKRLFRLALPLGVAVLLMSLIQQLPLLLVERLGDESRLGIFASMYYIVFAVSLSITALGESAKPRLARLFAVSDLRTFGRLVLKLVALAGVIGLGLVVAVRLGGRPLLGVLYGAIYAEDAETAETFAVLSVAGAVGFLATVLAYALIATRRFGQFLLPYVALTVLMIASQCWLIPRFHLTGAAYGTLLVNLVACGVLWIIVLATMRRKRAR